MHLVRIIILLRSAYNHTVMPCKDMPTNNAKAKNENVNIFPLALVLESNLT